MVTLNELLGVRVCAKCGKEFCAAPYHVYKRNRNWYCSWTCLNHSRDSRNKLVNAKRVEQLTLDGKSVKVFQSVANAVEYYGRMTPSNLRLACTKNTPYHGYLWRYVEEKEKEET